MLNRKNGIVVAFDDDLIAVRAIAFNAQNPAGERGGGDFRGCTKKAITAHDERRVRHFGGGERNRLRGVVRQRPTDGGGVVRRERRIVTGVRTDLVERPAALGDYRKRVVAVRDEFKLELTLLAVRRIGVHDGELGGIDSCSGGECEQLKAGGGEVRRSGIEQQLRLEHGGDCVCRDAEPRRGGKSTVVERHGLRRGGQGGNRAAERAIHRENEILGRVRARDGSKEGTGVVQNKRSGRRLAIAAIHVERRSRIARKNGVDGQGAPVRRVVAAILDPECGIGVQRNRAIKNEARHVLRHADGADAVDDHVRNRDLARAAVRLLLESQGGSARERERTPAEREVGNGLRRTQLLRRVHDEIGVLEIGNRLGACRTLRRTPADRRTYVASKRRIRGRVVADLVVRRGKRLRDCRYADYRQRGADCRCSHGRYVPSFHPRAHWPQAARILHFFAFPRQGAAANFEMPEPPGRRLSQLGRATPSKSERGWSAHSYVGDDGLVVGEVFARALALLRKCLVG